MSLQFLINCYQGAGVAVFCEFRPPWVPRGKWLCSHTNFSATTPNKNIIEFNDFSYTTVIKCYLLLYILFYIPWIMSFTIMLVRINCGCCVRSVPFVNLRVL